MTWKSSFAGFRGLRIQLLHNNDYGNNNKNSAVTVLVTILEMAIVMVIMIAVVRVRILVVVFIMPFQTVKVTVMLLLLAVLVSVGITMVIVLFIEILMLIVAWKLVNRICETIVVLMQNTSTDANGNNTIGTSATTLPELGGGVPLPYMLLYIYTCAPPPTRSHFLMISHKSYSSRPKTTGHGGVLHSQQTYCSPDNARPLLAANFKKNKSFQKTSYLEIFSVPWTFWILLDLCKFWRLKFGTRSICLFCFGCCLHSQSEAEHIALAPHTSVSMNIWSRSLQGPIALYIAKGFGVCSDLSPTFHKYEKLPMQAWQIWCKFTGVLEMLRAHRVAKVVGGGHPCHDWRPALD